MAIEVAQLSRRLLLDGGMGTALMARGLSTDREPTECWNVERPADVEDVHARFFAAGASAVQTNTFGGNRLRLQRFGKADQVRRYNLLGATLARSVRPDGALVIGSVGPSGAIPPPDGNADLCDLEDAFAEQAAALADGGVDLLHIETQCHPKEARAALRGCRRGAPALPRIASMSCRAHGEAYRTSLGYSAEQLLQVFLEEAVDGVGVNCTLIPGEMIGLIRMIRARTDLPLFARPTIAPTGAPPLLPDEFALGVLALFSAGATAVGGCCGTSPDDIAAARAALAATPV